MYLQSNIDKYDILLFSEAAHNAFPVSEIELSELFKKTSTKSKKGRGGGLIILTMYNDQQHRWVG